LSHLEIFQSECERATDHAQRAMGNSARLTAEGISRSS
jgi:hypothetical protein